MKNIPNITINNPNKPININVPNTGITGNKFVDWSGSNNQFIQSSSYNNLGNLNIPNINVPNINSSGNGSGGGSGLTTPFTQYVSKTPSYTAQEMVGWLEHMNNTQNLKFNLPYKEINLSGKNVTDEDMVFFASRMKNFAFHLDSLQLNHNSISDYGIQALFNCAFTIPLGRSVVHLKLNNCHFGDVGADLIAAYVRDGYMPATRTIDLHGNNVTKTAEMNIAAAIKQAPNKDLMATFDMKHAIMEVTKTGNYAMSSGIKTALKEFVSYAKTIGVDTTHVATNKSTVEYLKDGGKMAWNIGIGIAKCSNALIEVILLDTNAPSMAKNLAVEMYANKTVKKADIRLCLLWETHDAIVSPEGLDLAVKSLELLGEEGF